MDFSLSEDQQLMVDAFTELMHSRNWDVYFREYDEKHEYPFGWAETICELNFDHILLPEEYDGLSADWVTLAVAYEALGYEGGPTYVLYQLPYQDTVLRKGTEEQEEKILSFVGTDKQILNCVITRPSAGSSWNDMCTTYIRKGGKVYLSGHKTFITSSLYTPYLVVVARDLEDMDTHAEWFVDMSLPDITKEPLARLGLHMDSHCGVYFDNVEFEEKDLFGKEGNDFRRGMVGFDFEHFLVALTDYGTVYYTFEDAAKYTNQHARGGQAVARHQLVQLKFAGMKARLTSVRNMLYEIAWKHDNGQLLRGDCSMAKYYCPEVSFEVVDRALQVPAGVGITGDHHIQRFYHDLRVNRISGGADEMIIPITDRSALCPHH